MKRTKFLLAASLLTVALPALQGCFPAVAAGAAVGVLAVTDRRTVGTQTEDEGIEWKALSRVSDRFTEGVHINATSYNRHVLITGEVPDERTKTEIGNIVSKVENVQSIWNELHVGATSSFSARSHDTYITSKVKTRFVDAGQFTPTRVKVVTEAGNVFLLGIVNDQEAKSAVQVARTTDGVRKVVNVMEILSTAEIRRLDSATQQTASKGNGSK